MLKWFVILTVIWFFYFRYKKFIVDKKRYIEKKKNLGYENVYILFKDGNFMKGMVTKAILRLYESQNYNNLEYINVLDYKDNIRKVDLKNIHLMERRDILD